MGEMGDGSCCFTTLYLLFPENAPVVTQVWLSLGVENVIRWFASLANCLYSQATKDPEVGRSFQ
jgi:hypothetical protein